MGELIECMIADKKNETVVLYVKEKIAFLPQEKLIELYGGIHMRVPIEQQ